MDHLQQYSIGFSGLSNGSHSFSFEMDTAFFHAFEESEVKQALVEVQLEMEKSHRMLELDFHLKGWVQLPCDRCLEAYRQNVDQQQKLFVKLGHEYKEESEDVVVIPEGESDFNIAQYIYEYIHLGLPIKRVHPDATLEQPSCDPEMLERMARHKTGAAKKKAESASTWEALRKLRF